MKLNRYIILAAIGLGVGSIQSPASAADSNQSFRSLPSLTEEIRKSKTPSEAISAYATAFAATDKESTTERAFISRMIDFGMPELAQKQAEDLAMRGSDGMAYAVLAFSSARADKLDEAILQMHDAARLAPNDIFVQRTGGQVLAWYDVRKSEVKYEAAVQQAAEEIRERLGSRRYFSTAYDEIHDPIASLYATDESGSPILGNTDLATLGTYSASARGGFTSPMALFYQAPFALFPGYNYWYQPIGADVYYYQNYLQRGIGNGRLFPFPAVDRDTRFLKLPAGGFALVNDDGTAIYNSIQPGGYFNGFYGGGGFYGGPVFGGGLGYLGAPRNAGGFRGRGGGTRLSQRMGGGMGMNSPLGPANRTGISSQNDFSAGRPAPGQGFSPARRFGR